MKDLDLNYPEYRNNLAINYKGKGNALDELGTLQARKRAIACYNRAIALLGILDLKIPKYCNALASVHYDKGAALYRVGTPQALQRAIRSYDNAIGPR